MNVVAIHDGHNASVALMVNGEVLFATQEERYVGEKNIGGFPENALADLFEWSGLSASEIDIVVFAGTATHRSEGLVSRENMLSKYHELLTRDEGVWLKQKQRWKKRIRNRLTSRSKGPRREQAALETGFRKDAIRFVDHHRCHAAGAAYGSGWEGSFLVVTMDSSGDGLSGTVSRFSQGELKTLQTIPIDDSVARIYSLVTYLMGMVPMEHEYKLMGMAPFAEVARESREIAEFLKGLYQYSDYGLRYARAPNVDSVQDLGPRIREYLKFKRFDHIAAGVQLFVEEFTTEWIKRLIERTGEDRLALSGGLFMNVKLNKRVLEIDQVKDLYVLPSCGDESNVFGAAYSAALEGGEQSVEPIRDYYLGPCISNRDAEEAVEHARFESDSVAIKVCTDIESEIANLLSQNKIVARASGRMEFGARSLGNRAILANPADPEAVQTINKMIKSRDFWMPFAPSMINAEKYIINPKSVVAPYMILTFDTRPEKRNFLRGVMQAYDKTSRPQEVYQEWNPSYFRVIELFNELTGESAILNTSLNLHGLPLARTAEDVLFVFKHSGLRYLALGNFLLSKISDGRRCD